MVYGDMVFGDMVFGVMVYGDMVFGVVVTLFFCVLQVKGGIAKQLNIEVLHYDYHASFFDIYVSFHSCIS